jgi:broad specificity phosphatase PhoE
LDSLLASEGYTDGGDGRITWLSSPFLRTVQTSNDALNMFTKVNADNVQINPEYSIFELDGHGGKLHSDLPSMAERKLYFPRLNETYESMFVPKLPEARSEFLGRCDRAIADLNQRFPYRPKTAIVIVTHAAACIGLTRAASGLTLADVNAAGPCSVFRLTRTSDSEHWLLDHYSKKGGLNGHLDHLSVLSPTTSPWNHFGEKSNVTIHGKGYTGPPTGLPKHHSEL